MGREVVFGLPHDARQRVAGPLLVAVMDGLQLQWLHDPGAVDMPAVFRHFVTLLDPGRGDGETGGA